MLFTGEGGWGAHLREWLPSVFLKVRPVGSACNSVNSENQNFFSALLLQWNPQKRQTSIDKQIGKKNEITRQ